MPWTVADVDRHNAGLSPLKKRQWVHVANSVLAETGNEGEAIRKANAVVREALTDLPVISTRDAIRAQRHRHPGYAVLAECQRCVEVHLMEREVGMSHLPLDLLPFAEAEWSGAKVNDLPDSAFAYIEPGGSKDESGRTVPRSKRHFPIRRADGSPDPAHIRNALARLSQSGFGGQARAAVEAAAKAAGIGEPAASVREAKGDDHFYGAWKGGDAKSGGRPMTKAEQKAAADKANTPEGGLDKESGRPGPGDPEGRAAWDKGFKKSTGRDYDTATPQEWAASKAKYPNMSRADALDQHRLDMENERRNAAERAALHPAVKAEYDRLANQPGLHPDLAVAYMKAGAKAASDARTVQAAAARQMASHADANRLRLMAGSSNPDQSRAGMAELLKRAGAPGRTLDASTVRSLKRADVEHIAINSANSEHRSVARAELARRQSASTAKRSSQTNPFTGRTGAQMADRGSR